jgi:hypothetical protein
VDELHGASVDDCPGAEKCNLWRYSRRCVECPRGANPPRRIDRQAEQLACNHIQNLAEEWHSGLLSVEQLDPLERELLNLWQIRERAYVRHSIKHIAEVGALARSFAADPDDGPLGPAPKSATNEAKTANTSQMQPLRADY